MEHLSEEQLAILNENYPISADNSRLTFPKFGMESKDITKETGTGKNKKIELIQAAGTFYTEKDLGEINSEGKKVWTKTYIDGETVEGIITFHRYQLRKFDSSLNKFISSPIYDNENQVIPLYLDKQVIKRGTEKDLQSMYPALTQKGKPTSDLKKYTIIYFLYQGETYQFNLGVSSGWAFSTYKKLVNPSTVVTVLGSSEETFGTNTYRKVTFTKGSVITSTDFDAVLETQETLKQQVVNDDTLFLGTGEKPLTNMEEDIPFD